MPVPLREILAAILGGVREGGWTPAPLADVVSPSAFRTLMAQREAAEAQARDVARGLSRLAQGVTVPEYGVVNSLTELMAMPTLANMFQAFGTMPEYLGASKAALTRSEKEETALTKIVDTLVKAQEMMAKLQAKQAEMEANELLPERARTTLAELRSQRQIARNMPQYLPISLLSELGPASALFMEPTLMRSLQLGQLPLFAQILKRLGFDFTSYTPQQLGAALDEAMRKVRQPGATQPTAPAQPGQQAQQPQRRGLWDILGSAWYKAGEWLMTDLENIYRELQRRLTPWPKWPVRPELKLQLREQ